MGGQRYNQVSASAGEISPRLHDRDDVEIWHAGLKTQNNFISWPQGGMCRRAGMEYINPIKDPDNPPNVFEFEFSQDHTQSYALEAGHLYLRVWTYSGQVIKDDLPYEQVSPYSIDQVFDIQYVQSGDVIFMVHHDVPLHKLSRYGHDDWRFEAVVMIDGPYKSENLDLGHTIQADALSGSGVNLTASKDTWLVGDIGRVMRLRFSGEWSWCEITGWTDATHVVVTTKRDFKGSINTDSDQWRMGAFGGVDGYADAVGFYESRLSLSSFQAKHSSVTNDFVNFAPSAEDDAGVNTGESVADDAVSFYIQAQKISPIKWLHEMKQLIMGTGSSIRAIGGANGDPMTPTNAQQAIQDGVPAAPIQPVEVGGGALVFIGRYFKRLFSLSFDLTRDTRIAKELSQLSEHLTRGGIKQIAYQSDPHSIIWVLMQSGQLRSFTYIPDQKVAAWARATVGIDVNGLGVTDFKIHGICCAPGQTETRLWATATWTANDIKQGAMVRLAEFFEPADKNDKLGMAFADLFTRYQGPAIATLDNLNWLEGLRVKIVADGEVQVDQPVSGGSITLQAPATDILVGLPYWTEGETLGVPGQILDSKVKSGEKKRIKRVILKLLNSLGGGILMPSDEVKSFKTNLTSYPIGASEPLYSGSIELTHEGGFTDDGRVRFGTEDPLPLNVLSITPKFTSNPD